MQAAGRVFKAVSAGAMTLAMVTAIGVTGVTGEAAAQQLPASVSAEHFEPGAAQHSELLNLQRPRVLGHLEPSVGLFFHAADDPVQYLNNEDDAIAARLVDEQYKAEIAGAVGLFDFLQVGLAVPVVLHQTGGDLATIGGSGRARGSYVGDIRASVKARLLDPAEHKGFGVGLSSFVFVPSGATESFNSDGAVRGGPRVSAGWRSKAGYEVVGNVGVQFRRNTDLLNTTAGHTLRWGVGGAVPFGETGLAAMASVFGSRTLVSAADGELSPESSPAEALLGMRFDATSRLRLQAGGGLGISQGLGAPDFRVFASAHWLFRRAEQEQEAQGPSDTDGDGLMDPDDQCVEKPEDVDQFEDGDGCPDPDNDGDGIPDVDDKCPDTPGLAAKAGCPEGDKDGDGLADRNDDCPEKPEDKDDFEDGDGCPDPDNDQDGVLDGEDRCINTKGPAANEGCPDGDKDGDGIVDREDGCAAQPEDKDGFEDGDGCPDTDNDQDGITDVKDDCPDEPETVNGHEDADGCPDEAKVKVVKQSIEFSEKVHFATGKATIKQRSYDLLADVVSLLEAYPQITKLRIGGHTDDRGAAGYNQDLSRRRAEAVRAFLIERGIDSARLVARGFGESKPVETNDTEAGRAANRRVELDILQVDGKPVDGDGPVKLERSK